MKALVVCCNVFLLLTREIYIEFERNYLIYEWKLEGGNITSEKSVTVPMYPVHEIITTCMKKNKKLKKKICELPQKDEESPSSYFLISLTEITSSKLYLVTIIIYLFIYLLLLLLFLIYPASEKWLLDMDSSISVCSQVSMATSQSIEQINRPIKS